MAKVIAHSTHSKAVSAHKRSARSDRFPWRIFVAIFSAILIFLLIQVYLPSYRQLQMSEDVLKKLETQSAVQQANIERIDKEAARLGTDQYKMLLAREKYDFTIPGEKLYKMMPSPNVQPLDSLDGKKPDDRSWFARTGDRFYLIVN